MIPDTILPNADLVYDGDKMSLIPNFDGDNEHLIDLFVEEFYEKYRNPMLQYVIFDNNSIFTYRSGKMYSEFYGKRNRDTNGVGKSLL